MTVLKAYHSKVCPTKKCTKRVHFSAGQTLLSQHFGVLKKNDFKIFYMACDKSTNLHPLLNDGKMTT